MKKLILLATTLFVTATMNAQATEYFIADVMPNYLGGEIMVTELSCDAGKEGLKVVATDRFKDIVNVGCMFLTTENDYFVQWLNGSIAGSISGSAENLSCQLGRQTHDVIDPNQLHFKYLFFDFI